MQEGFPVAQLVKNVPATQEWTCALILSLGRSWRRKWNPLRYSLPGGSYRQRSLAGHSHGVAESDVT